MASLFTIRLRIHPFLTACLVSTFLTSILAACTLLQLVLSYSNLTSCTAPTSFCKCTCFTNSTIIPLDAPNITPAKPPSFLYSRQPEHSESEEPLPEDPPPSDNTDPLENTEEGTEENAGKEGGKEEEGDRKEYRAGNCNDCNRQFCLDYNLPICRGAGMEDVFTTCFRGCSPSLSSCILLVGGRKDG